MINSPSDFVFSFGNSYEETTGVANPWQYAGGYLDNSTGLYKMGTRYYNPTLGRWTQEDPVGPQLTNPDSLNPYLYAQDDPSNNVDPSGKDCFSDVFISIIVGGLSTLISVGGALYGLGSLLSALPEGLAAASAAIEVLPAILGILAAIGLALTITAFAWAVAQTIAECSGFPFLL